LFIFIITLFAVEFVTFTTQFITANWTLLTIQSEETYDNLI
jgi:hypothetical protein